MAKHKLSAPSGESVKNKQPRISVSGNLLAGKLPAGEIITDNSGKMWRIGKSIAVGGFGDIYLASDEIKKPVDRNSSYVVKAEFHTNGTLYTERHCYSRIGKIENIKEWMKCKSKRWLGVPTLIATGKHVFKGTMYRFIIIERFKDSLENLLKRQGSLHISTVFSIGIKLLDILEYIHSFGYIHGDIKASNILIHPASNEEIQIYLVDYGLATKFAVNGVHKEEKEDKSRAHSGTTEFISRDGHKGIISRRSDLEILAFNFVRWMCHKLPWEDNLNDYDYVHERKSYFMSRISHFIQTCFPHNSPEDLASYISQVANLDYDEKPDYDFLRRILSRGLTSRGIIYDDMVILDMDQHMNRRSMRAAMRHTQKTVTTLTTWEQARSHHSAAETRPTDAMLKQMKLDCGTSHPVATIG
ncbi:VRK1 [Cordylochernes scorpioides]|uniref:non-specific serine/threonine protein kinase n=1 Tax=Cordylochernes scorpioides TaxID=51811 RepID=A0ABY6K049_9ARAC|nr:VRK1 [Cordylochernes scorpioides]